MAKYVKKYFIFFHIFFRSLVINNVNNAFTFRGEEYDASVEICRIKDNLARHKNDLHAMLLESVDYMGNTNSDLGNSSILESGLGETKSLAGSGSRKSSSAISNR